MTVQEEFVCSLAAMILADGDAEMSAANIKALVDASGNEVATYWPGIFANHMADGKFDTLLYTLGSGGGGGGGGGAAGGDAGGEAAEEKKEEKVEEEVDFSGGMDMFGGGGGGGDY